MREQLGKPIPSPVVPGQRLVRDYPLEPLTLEEASGCLTGGTAPQDGITRPAQVVIPYGIVTFGEALARGETARCHFAAKLKEAG